MTQVAGMPIQPGEAAPEFAVPSVQDDRTICLADYPRSNPLLLGLFPGLYCPFCRRALAQMAATSEKLKPLGVDTLAVVGTELDNARLYFAFRPTPLALGADPRLATHRSYGVPRPEPTPELMQRRGTGAHQSHGRTPGTASDSSRGCRADEARRLSADCDRRARG